MKKDLILKGKTIVFVDWANVYGWKKSLKKVIDTKKLFEYLKEYENVSEIKFYFGKDDNNKSKEFLNFVENIGYATVTKPVKHIFVAKVEDQKIYRRKCDFDMEISIDTHKAVKDDFESFVFFTGDGDFEPLYRMLSEINKQVIVIYAHGHLGKEIYQIKKGVYKKPINKILKSFI